jgi:sporulation protein YlmC with PRC-barrel domain
MSMTKTELFAALMASTLLAAPAMAQSAQPSPPPQATQPPAQTQPPKADQKPMDANKDSTAAAPAATQTVQQAGQWRMSKLVGLDVYNNNNEKIGDISELIADKDGNLQILVIGVGGFLGMGQHDVGLAWDQVKFVNEPAKTAASSPTTTTRTTTTTGSGATATTTTAARDYPDHAVVSMTKDQLKALPAFKYASDTKNR